LFASCLEQSGLNALVIFTKGHAFTGCWLSDDDLSSTVIYDAQSLRKRCQLNELIVFETTLCTHKPPAKFSLAKQEAEDKLNNDADFVLAIDIKRARSLSDFSFLMCTIW
jgi:predicted metal-binding transcription factor (methanogenesis marker protein 9)